MTHKIRFAALLSIVLATGCASTYTQRDKTWKGAGIGAAAGAVVGAVVGEGEADRILAGAAIGAGLGAGIGAYMDAQEEKLARIPGTTVERVGKDKLLIHFNNDLLFGFDSAALNTRSQDTLYEVSDVVQSFPKTAVVVQGHTDSVGSDSYNLSLSQDRARAVNFYLADLGVAPARMTAVGYGESEPRASNSSEQGRALNRRVSVLLKAKAR